MRAHMLLCRSERKSQSDTFSFCRFRNASLLGYLGWMKTVEMGYCVRLEEPYRCISCHPVLFLLLDYLGLGSSGSLVAGLLAANLWEFSAM